MYSRKITDNGCDNLHLKISGLRNVVNLKGCDELLPYFSGVFRDSSFEVVSTEPYTQSVITLAGHNEGYSRSSIWLTKPVVHADPLDAVCDFSVDYFHSYVADNPGMLCLHTAAARLGDGLMLFPAYYKSGKSLFSAYLAWLGVELFTDDALPVTHKDNLGIAMGVYPRLRLPLPELIDDGFRAFVSRNIAQVNKQYCYLKLGSDLLTKMGTKEKIKAITILSRVKEQPASLEEISLDEIVKELILRNFARNNKAVDIVDRIMNITASSICYKLTYSDLREAGELLLRKFSAR